MPGLKGLELALQMGDAGFRRLALRPFCSSLARGLGPLDLGSGELDPEGISLALQGAPVEAFPFGRGLLAFQGGLQRGYGDPYSVGQRRGIRGAVGGGASRCCTRKT